MECILGNLVHILTLEVQRTTLQWSFPWYQYFECRCAEDYHAYPESVWPGKTSFLWAYDLEGASQSETLMMTVPDPMDVLICEMLF